MPSEIYKKAATAGAPAVDLVKLTRRVAEDIHRLRFDWDDALSSSDVDLIRHEDQVTLAGDQVNSEGHENGFNNRWRRLVDVIHPKRLPEVISLLIVVPVTEAGLIGEVQIRCKNQKSSGDLLCTIFPSIDDSAILDVASLDQAPQYSKSAAVQAAEDWLTIDFSEMGIVKELGSAFGVLLRPSVVDGEHAGINVWESDHPHTYHSEGPEMYWSSPLDAVRTGTSLRAPVTDATGHPRCVEFRVATQGYKPSGSISVKCDLGETPPSQASGEWQIADWAEPDAAVSHVAWASDTGAFSGEETSLGAVADGSAISVKKRYYKLTATFTASPDRLSGAGLIEAGPRFTRTDVFAKHTRPIWGYQNSVGEIQITEGSVNPEQGSSSAEKPYITFTDDDISRRFQEYDYQGEELLILRGYDYPGFAESDCEVRGRARIMDYEQDDKVSLETINLLKDLAEHKLPRQSEDQEQKTIINVVDTHPVDAAILLLKRAGVRDSMLDTTGMAAVKAVTRIAGYRVRRVLSEEKALDELLNELLTPILGTTFETGGKIGISRVDWSASPVTHITNKEVLKSSEQFKPRLREGRGYQIFAYGERPDGQGGRYYDRVTPAADVEALKRFSGKGETTKYSWLAADRYSDAATIAEDLLFARKRGLPVIEVNVATSLAWLQPGMTVQYDSELYRRRGVSNTNPLLCHVAKVVPERNRVELTLVVMLDAQDSAPGGLLAVSPPADFTASGVEGGVQFELTASPDTSVTQYRVEQALAGTGKWKLIKTWTPGDFTGGQVLWQDVSYARLGAFDFRAVAVANLRRSEPVTVNGFRVQSTPLSAPACSLSLIQKVFKLTLDTLPAGAVSLLIEHREFGQEWERIDQAGSTFGEGEVIAFWEPSSRGKVKEPYGRTVDRFRVACVDKYGQVGAYTDELRVYFGPILGGGEQVPGAVTFDAVTPYEIVHQAHGDYYRIEALLNLVLPSDDIDWQELLEVRRRSNGGEGDVYGDWEELDNKPLVETEGTPPPQMVEYRDSSQVTQGWKYQYEVRVRGNNGIPGTWSSTQTVEVPEDTTAPDVPSLSVFPMHLLNMILLDPPTEGGVTINDFARFQVQAYIESDGFWFDLEQRDGRKFEHQLDASDLGQRVKYRARAWDTSNNVSSWCAESGWNTVLKVGFSALDSSVNSLLTQVTTNENSIISQGTLIQQNADGILLRAYQTSLDTTNGRVSTAESSITQNATQIDLRVREDGVVSAINLSPEAILIQASKIALQGQTITIGDPEAYYLTFNSTTGELLMAGTFNSAAGSELNTEESIKIGPVGTSNHHEVQVISSGAIQGILGGRGVLGTSGTAGLWLKNDSRTSHGSWDVAEIDLYPWLSKWTYGGNDALVITNHGGPLGTDSMADFVMLSIKARCGINITGEIPGAWGSGYLQISGEKVLTSRLSAIGTASPVSSLSLASGSDSVDRAAFNTALATMVTEINALKDKLNTAIARMGATSGHGLTSD